MPRRDGRPWVGKVTPHGNRFRLASGVGGSPAARASFATREEAEKARAAILRQIAAREEMTLEEALMQFEVYKEEGRGNKPLSAERDRRRVVALLGRDTGPLPRLTPEAATALYTACRARPTEHTGQPPSAAEHRACLAAAKRFGKWLVRQKVWTGNPFAEVEATGRPKAGGRLGDC